MYHNQDTLEFFKLTHEYHFLENDIFKEHNSIREKYDRLMWDVLVETSNPTVIKRKIEKMRSAMDKRKQTTLKIRNCCVVIYGKKMYDDGRHDYPLDMGEKTLQKIEKYLKKTNYEPIEDCHHRRQSSIDSD